MGTLHDGLGRMSRLATGKLGLTHAILLGMGGGHVWPSMEVPRYPDGGFDADIEAIGHDFERAMDGWPHPDNEDALK